MTIIFVDLIDIKKIKGKGGGGGSEYGWVYNVYIIL